MEHKEIIFQGLLSAELISLPSGEKEREDGTLKSGPEVRRRDGIAKQTKENKKHLPACRLLIYHA